MSLLKKISLFFVTLTLLFACATPSIVPSSLQQLSAMEGSLKTRGGYDSYLALEYLVFSRKLYSIKDAKNSDYFAEKGLKVAKGEYIIPENPLTWKADPTQLEEMILMQKRLEIVSDTPHMKFHLPIQMAHLTYLYDCWISRESKAVFRADELAQCRTRFSKLLDEIENYIDDLKRDRLPKVDIKEAEFERFEILFDFDNFQMNDKAVKDLVAVLKYLKTLEGNFRVMVVGNADRSGIELYNQNLAFNRADIVMQYLIKNGVDKDLVEYRSLGEDFPDIITRDGMQLQSNRSAGIYVLKGYASFSSFPLPLIENYVYREEIKKARVERGLEN